MASHKNTNNVNTVLVHGSGPLQRIERLLECKTGARLIARYSRCAAGVRDFKNGDFDNWPNQWLDDVVCPPQDATE